MVVLSELAEDVLDGIKEYCEGGRHLVTLATISDWKLQLGEVYEAQLRGALQELVDDEQIVVADGVDTWGLKVPDPPSFVAELAERLGSSVVSTLGYDDEIHEFEIMLPSQFQVLPWMEHYDSEPDEWRTRHRITFVYFSQDGTWSCRLSMIHQEYASSRYDEDADDNPTTPEAAFESLIEDRRKRLAYDGQLIDLLTQEG
jgi:hypothetical protein